MILCYSTIVGYSKKLIETRLGYKVFQELPNQNELNSFYAMKYYQNLAKDSTYQIEYSVEENLERSLKIELLYEFIKLHISKNLEILPPGSITKIQRKKFLDVGCGEGYVLKFFRDHAWEIVGVDFSTHAIRTNNPELESFIIQGDVYELCSSMEGKGYKFDVIFLGNVLEHVLEPVALIDQLKNLLEKDGLLVITVPNDFSDIQSFLLDNGKVDSEYWITYPDHLNYFNLDNLSKLLLDRNLPVIDQFSDFPIEWFLVNSNSNYILNKLLGKDAHNARLSIATLINSSKNLEVKMNFWRSLSALGMGRTITTISRNS
jgi:2-polyprenyl-3-methyl-5-hydroxy-6-metoxy-1,4-benzoquinol methylase